MKKQDTIGQPQKEPHDLLIILLNKVEKLGDTIQINQNNILTEKQVLEMLGIGAKTLRSYRTNGLLAYSKIGNKFFYRMSDINKMLDNARVESDYSEAAYG